MLLTPLENEGSLSESVYLLFTLLYDARWPGYGWINFIILIVGRSNSIFTKKRGTNSMYARIRYKFNYKTNEIRVYFSLSTTTRAINFKTKVDDWIFFFFSRLSAHVHSFPMLFILFLASVFPLANRHFPYFVWHPQYISITDVDIGHQQPHFSYESCVTLDAVRN